MGIPFTIQTADNERLVQLKSLVKAKSKVEVLRRALDLLEEEVAKQKRLKQWKSAAKRVGAQSARVHRDFQKYSLLKKG